MSEIRKNRVKGIIGTVLFHVIILGLLIIFGFSTALPLPGEEGVEVNLGTDMRGSGKIQPEQSSTKRKNTPPPPVKEKVKEDIATQNIEPAPAIEKIEEKVVKEETPVVEKPKQIEEPEEVVKEPEINENALYPGPSKKPNTSQGEGITGEQGDQGNPKGTINAKEYLGKGGFGDGNDWDLEGRNPSYLPKPSTSFSEHGTVVVQITVNKYGKVIKAVAIDKGSNTTNTSLRRLAEDAAKKAVFNADMNAPEVQRGTITYHFVVKN